MSALRIISFAGLMVLAVGLICPYGQGAVPLGDESMAMLRGGCGGGGWVCSSNQTCLAPLCSGPPGGGSCGRCDGGASIYTCKEDQLSGKANCRQNIPVPSGCGKIIPDATCWMDYEGYYRCQFGNPGSAYGTCNRYDCTTWD